MAKKGSILDKLAKVASAKKPTKKSKSQSRDVCRLDGNDAELADRFAAAYVVEKLAVGQKATQRGGTLPILQRVMLTKWAESGVRPDNIRFTTDNSAMLLQCANKVKFHTQEDQSPVDALREAGFSAKDAAKIAKEELVTKRVISIKPLTDLAEGSQEEVELGNKIIQLLIDNLTEQEQAACLVQEEIVSVHPSFLDRAYKHVNTLEKLRDLLGVIRPEWKISSVQWSGNVEEAAKNLTAPKSQDGTTKFKHGGKEYTAVVSGKTVKVMVGNKKAFQKECANNSHANATVRKLASDSEYLESNL